MSVLAQKRVYFSDAIDSDERKNLIKTLRGVKAIVPNKLSANCDYFVALDDDDTLYDTAVENEITVVTPDFITAHVTSTSASTKPSDYIFDVKLGVGKKSSPPTASKKSKATATPNTKDTTDTTTTDTGRTTRGKRKSASPDPTTTVAPTTADPATTTTKTKKVRVTNPTDPATSTSTTKKPAAAKADTKASTKTDTKADTKSDVDADATSTLKVE